MEVIKIKAHVVENIFSKRLSDTGLTVRISTENEESDK